MKIQFSKGALHQNKQQQARTLKEHDDQLRAAVIETCEKMNVPDGVANALVNAAIERFVIASDGTIRPVSSYASIEDFIEAHKSQAPASRKTAIEIDDERAMRKAELYEQLQYFAKKGDIKMYRAVRAEYAQL